MKIITAEDSHSKAIAGLHRVLGKEHLFVPAGEGGESHIRDLLENRGDRVQVFLAQDPQGQLLGNVWVGRSSHEERAHVAGFGIAVLGAFTGLGLGTALMDHAERWAREKGCRFISTEVAWANTQAVSFLIKRDYELLGLLRANYTKNGEFFDEYIARKAL